MSDGEKKQSRRVWTVLKRLGKVLLVSFFVAISAFAFTPFYPCIFEAKIREQFSGPPEWDTILSARVPGSGLVQYRERSRISRYRIEDSLLWYKCAGSKFDYAISEGMGSLADFVQLRATKDHKGIWLVGNPNFFWRLQMWDPEMSEAELAELGPDDKRLMVIATLDTTSAEFIINRGIQDPNTGELRYTRYPDWASPDGGILLDECDLRAEGTYRHLR